MFTNADMNTEFECAHCEGLFRNLSDCPHCGNPKCRLVRYGHYGSGPSTVAVSIDKPTYIGGHRFDVERNEYVVR